MENTRVELVTSCLQGRRSPNWANPPRLFRTFIKYHILKNLSIFFMKFSTYSCQNMQILFSVFLIHCKKYINTPSKQGRVHNFSPPFYRFNYDQFIWRWNCSIRQEIFSSVSSSSSAIWVIVFPFSIHSFMHI